MLQRMALAHQIQPPWLHPGISTRPQPQRLQGTHRAIIHTVTVLKPGIPSQRMGMGVAQLFRRPLGRVCYTDRMTDSRAPTTTTNNELKSLHKICENNDGIEDAYHFFFQCSIHSDIRTELKQEIQHIWTDSGRNGSPRWSVALLLAPSTVTAFTKLQSPAVLAATFELIQQSGRFL